MPEVPAIVLFLCTGRATRAKRFRPGSLSLCSGECGTKKGLTQSIQGRWKKMSKGPHVHLPLCGSSPGSGNSLSPNPGGENENVKRSMDPTLTLWTYPYCRWCVELWFWSVPWKPPLRSFCQLDLHSVLSSLSPDSSRPACTRILLPWLGLSCRRD